MKLETEDDLAYTYESITKMYHLIEKTKSDDTGHADTREAEIDGVRSMIRKLERQIAAHYANHPERLASPQKAA